MKKKILAQTIPLLILAAATSVKVILGAKELWDTVKDEKIKKAASSAKEEDTGLN
ncbi:MAG: hypothetical protein IJX90_01805 [Blautia sp.]|nr:hypothetical protein [Blautia sp.]